MAKVSVGRVRLGGGGAPLRPFGPGFVRRRRRGRRRSTEAERLQKGQKEEAALSRREAIKEAARARVGRLITTGVSGGRQVTKEQIEAVRGGPGDQRETLGQAKIRRIKEQTEAETARQARSRVIREGRQAQQRRMARKRRPGQVPTIRFTPPGGEQLVLKRGATALGEDVPRSAAERETRRKLLASFEQMRTADEPRQAAARAKRARRRATGGRKERFVTEAEDVASIEAGTGKIAGRTVPRESVEGTGALQAALEQVRPPTPADQAAAGAAPAVTPPAASADDLEFFETARNRLRQDLTRSAIEVLGVDDAARLREIEARLFGGQDPTRISAPTTPEPSGPTGVPPAGPPTPQTVQPERVPQPGPLPPATLGPPPTGFVPFNAFPDFPSQPPVTGQPLAPPIAAPGVQPTGQITPQPITAPITAPVVAPTAAIAAPPGADRETRAAFALRRISDREADLRHLPVAQINEILQREFREEISEFPEIAGALGQTGAMPFVPAAGAVPAQPAVSPRLAFGRQIGFDPTQRLDQFQIRPPAAAGVGDVIVPEAPQTPEQREAVRTGRVSRAAALEQINASRALRGAPPITDPSAVGAPGVTTGAVPTGQPITGTPEEQKLEITRRAGLVPRNQFTQLGGDQGVPARSIKSSLAQLQIALQGLTPRDKARVVAEIQNQEWHKNLLEDIADLAQPGITDLFEYGLPDTPGAIEKLRKLLENFRDAIQSAATAPATPVK